MDHISPMHQSLSDSLLVKNYKKKHDFERHSANARRLVNELQISVDHVNKKANKMRQWLSMGEEWFKQYTHPTKLDNDTDPKIETSDI